MPKYKRILSTLVVAVLVALLFLANAEATRAIKVKNTLIIESLDYAYQPLYGFAYRIYDEDTGALVAKVDLSDDYRASVELPDGEYRICEVQRPFNYIEMPDKIVRFPYFIRYGQITRTLILYPKHKLDVGPPQPFTKIGKTGELGDNDEMLKNAGLLLLVCVLLYLLKKSIDKQTTMVNASESKELEQTGVNKTVVNESFERELTKTGKE